jgi:hypothetical protein
MGALAEQTTASDAASSAGVFEKKPSERQNKTEFRNKADRCGYIGFLPEENCHVNLAGYYGYLETAYYNSQDTEAEGKEIHPTCREIMDCSVVPIFLERARLEGLPVPDFYVTNEYFEPPVIIDPINPFMSRHSIVLKSGHQDRVAKSLTRNYTYAICCQELPPGAKIGSFRSILGWCPQSRYQSLSREIWRIFRMPLAHVRVIILTDGDVMVSRLLSLPFRKLTSNELRHIENRVEWPI